MMAHLQLRYIHRFRDRHGKERFYFRRPGCERVPLPGLPGSAEFMAAYQSALAGSTPRPQPGAKRIQPGSFDALAIAYYQSAEFHQLAPSTKATYRNIVEDIRRRAGHLPIAYLQRDSVRHIIARRADTPAAANALLKMLRILMRLALDEGWRRDDPTAGVRRIRSKSEGFRTWTDAEIAAFEARWPIGTRERLALALLLYTGQRRSDVVRMGRQHVRGNAIEIRQQKTGERLLIPIHPHLRAALDACPAEHLTFLTTSFGKPFTFAGFGNWFADAVKAAGLSGVSAHGLRKAAARTLAEAGCTPHQIAAITGHRSLREVERYTRAADQARLAEVAITKMRGSPKGEH
jgi:integrase